MSDEVPTGTISAGIRFGLAGLRKDADEAQNIAVSLGKSLESLGTIDIKVPAGIGNLATSLSGLRDDAISTRSSLIGLNEALAQTLGFSRDASTAVSSIASQIRATGLASTTTATSLGRVGTSLKAIADIGDPASMALRMIEISADGAGDGAITAAAGFAAAKREAQALTQQVNNATNALNRSAVAGKANTLVGMGNGSGGRSPIIPSRTRSTNPTGRYAMNAATGVTALVAESAYETGLYDITSVFNQNNSRMSDAQRKANESLDIRLSNKYALNANDLLAGSKNVSDLGYKGPTFDTIMDDAAAIARGKNAPVAETELALASFAKEGNLNDPKQINILANQLAKAGQYAGGMTISDLDRNWKIPVGNLQNLGVSFQESLGLLTTGSEHGYGPSTVATQVKGMVNTELNNNLQTQKGEAFFKRQTGVDISKYFGAFGVANHPPSELFDTIESATAKFGYGKEGDAERAGLIAKLLPATRGRGLAIALANMGRKDYLENVGALAPSGVDTIHAQATAVNATGFGEVQQGYTQFMNSIKQNEPLMHDAAGILHDLTSFVTGTVEPFLKAFMLLPPPVRHGVEDVGLFGLAKMALGGLGMSGGVDLMGGNVRANMFTKLAGKAGEGSGLGKILNFLGGTRGGSPGNPVFVAPVGPLGGGISGFGKRAAQVSEGAIAGEEFAGAAAASEESGAVMAAEFGAGGPVGLAIGATVLAIGGIAYAWSKASDAAKASASKMAALKAYVNTSDTRTNIQHQIQINNQEVAKLKSSIPSLNDGRGNTRSIALNAERVAAIQRNIAAINASTKALTTDGKSMSDSENIRRNLIRDIGLADDEMKRNSDAIKEFNSATKNHASNRTLDIIRSTHGLSPGSDAASLTARNAALAHDREINAKAEAQMEVHGKKLNADWSKSMALISTTTSKELGKIPGVISGQSPAATQSAHILGGDVITGLQSGMLGKESSLLKTSDGIAKDTLKQYRASFDSHSPSLEMLLIGVDVAEGLIVGMDSKRGEVTAKAHQITLEAKFAADEASIYGKKGHKGRKPHDYTHSDASNVLTASGMADRLGGDKTGATIAAFEKLLGNTHGDSARMGVEMGLNKALTNIDLKANLKEKMDRAANALDAFNREVSGVADRAFSFKRSFDSSLLRAQGKDPQADLLDAQQLAQDTYKANNAAVQATLNDQLHLARRADQLHSPVEAARIRKDAYVASNQGFADNKTLLGALNSAATDAYNQTLAESAKSLAELNISIERQKDVFDRKGIETPWSKFIDNTNALNDQIDSDIASLNANAIKNFGGSTLADAQATPGYQAALSAINGFSNSVFSSGATANQVAYGKDTQTKSLSDLLGKADDNREAMELGKAHLQGGISLKDWYGDLQQTVDVLKNMPNPTREAKDALLSFTKQLSDTAIALHEGLYNVSNTMNTVLMWTRNAVGASAGSATTDALNKAYGPLGKGEKRESFGKAFGTDFKNQMRDKLFSAAGQVVDNAVNTGLGGLFGHMFGKAKGDKSGTSPKGTPADPIYVAPANPKGGTPTIPHGGLTPAVPGKGTPGSPDYPKPPSGLQHGMGGANTMADLGLAGSTLADVGMARSHDKKTKKAGILGLVGGVIGGIAGSFSPMGWMAGAQIGEGAGSFLGSAFAAGGSPPVGKISLVGERGPELFVPHSSGTIIPNGKFGGNAQNHYSFVINHHGDNNGAGDVESMHENWTNQVMRQLAVSTPMIGTPALSH